MEDLTKKPLVDIFTEMAYLDRDIGLAEIKIKNNQDKINELLQSVIDLSYENDKNLLRYEEYRLEVIKRFPYLENEEAFKKKVRKLYDNSKRSN